MGNKKATAKSGTVYTQFNDSTYRWDGAGGSHGTVEYHKNKKPEVSYFVYQGYGVPEEQVFMRSDLDSEYQGHLDNVKYLKDNNMFDTDWNRFKNWIKSIIPLKQEGGYINDGIYTRYKKGGCLECGGKVKKNKYIKSNSKGDAFEDLVNKSYSNKTVPNHGAGAMGLEGINKAYNNYANTIDKEAADDWKFNALGSLLTGTALSPLIVPTTASPSLIPAYSALMIKSLTPDDAAIAKKRKEVKPDTNNGKDSKFQEVLNIPKNLLDEAVRYIYPDLLKK